MSNRNVCYAALMVIWQQLIGGLAMEFYTDIGDPLTFFLTPPACQNGSFKIMVDTSLYLRGFSNKQGRL